MTDSITVAQDAIMARVRELFPGVTVREAAIPVEQTIPRDANGMFKPYIAVQFGDVQAEGSRNMASALHDNYVLIAYMGCVASDPDTAKRMMNRMNVGILGFEIPNGGEMRKRAGGVIYIIPAQMGAVDAYVAPASFKAPIQLIQIV